MTYQPPVGIWKSTPERRLLWACEQVLHRVKREIPERGAVAKWEAKIARSLIEPVLAFNWERWYRENVSVGDAVAMAKAEENVPEEIIASWQGVHDEITEELWVAAAKMRTKGEGLPFDPDDLRSGMDEAFKMVKGIATTQAEVLRRMMKLSLEEGEGQFGFAKRIRQEWPLVATRKAEQIAVTEWNRAASHATFKGYVRQRETHKVWFTAGDNRVCPICEANSADGEIGIEKSFASGDLYPPAHPDCRCNISSAVV